MNVGVDAKELDRLADECVFPISTKQVCHHQTEA
jgi:hypothetical protein